MCDEASNGITLEVERNFQVLSLITIVDSLTSLQIFSSAHALFVLLTNLEALSLRQVLALPKATKVQESLGEVMRSSNKGSAWPPKGGGAEVNVWEISPKG